MQVRPRRRQSRSTQDTHRRTLASASDLSPPPCRVLGMPRSVSSTYKTHTDTAIQLHDSATRGRRGVPPLLAMSAVTAVTCCMTRRQLLWSQQGTFPRQRKRECGEHITHAAWTCHAAHMLCKPPHGLHALRTERSAPHFVHFVPRENRKPAVKRYILVKHHHGCVVCIDPKHGQTHDSRRWFTEKAGVASEYQTRSRVCCLSCASVIAAAFTWAAEARVVDCGTSHTCCRRT